LEKKWYVIHVYSGQEKKIEAYLNNEIQKTGLESKITQILIPQEEVIEMKNGKKKVKNKMFFPGYMFVEMVLDNETQHLIQSAPGVINFVGSHNKPQTLHTSEIERILGKVKEKEREDRTKIPYKVGDSIKVTDGPFNDFTGYVEEVNEEKSKVKVMVSIFGRPTPVELDFLQIELENK